MAIYRDKWNFQEDEQFSEWFTIQCCVLILMILVAISFKVYKGYVNNARMTVFYNAYLDYKNHIGEYYADRERFPQLEEIAPYLADLDSMYEGEFWKLRATSEYEDGMLTFHLESGDKDVDGKTFSVQPVVDPDKGVIVWLCGYATHPDVEEFIKPHKTTLDEKYLVSVCR